MRRLPVAPSAGAGTAPYLVMIRPRLMIGQMLHFCLFGVEIKRLLAYPMSFSFLPVVATVSIIFRVAESPLVIGAVKSNIG